MNRAPLSAVSDGADSAEARGDAAPSHQPTHRRLHRLWTNGALDERNAAAGHAATTMPHERVYGQRTPEEHAPLAKARRGLHRDDNNGTAGSGSYGGGAVRPPRRPGPPPWKGRGRAARKQRRYPAIVGPLARPSPDRRYSAILSKRHPARMSCRAPWRTLPRTVREVGLTSRTGPPPAGNGAAVSPSPLSPVQRADPRGTQTSVPPIAGPERTAGRTATHREHAAPRPARRRPDGPDHPHGQQSRHPDVCPLTVGIGRTTLCSLVFSTGGHIPRGSATCVCRRSTEVRTWGGIGTNAARRPR